MGAQNDRPDWIKAAEATKQRILVFDAWTDAQKKAVAEAVEAKDSGSLLSAADVTRELERRGVEKPNRFQVDEYCRKVLGRKSFAKP